MIAILHSITSKNVDYLEFKLNITFRDREIRFIDWEKSEHIAHWRFYSEFSWVPWVSWSFVGSNIIVSIGNPQNDCVLNSIIESINLGLHLFILITVVNIITTLIIYFHLYFVVNTTQIWTTLKSNPVHVYINPTHPIY